MIKGKFSFYVNLFGGNVFSFFYYFVKLFYFKFDWNLVFKFKLFVDLFFFMFVEVIDRKNIYGMKVY